MITFRGDHKLQCPVIIRLILLPGTVAPNMIDGLLQLLIKEEEAHLHIPIHAVEAQVMTGTVK
jgi:hypothetical protein